MRFRITPLSLALALGFALPAAHAADAAAPAASPVTLASAPIATVAAPVRVTSVEGITEYRLANGLRVLLAPDASKPTTTVNLTIQVGSRMEKYGETGMAHLLEHLMFKGTPSLPGKTIVQEFAKRGMRWNGTTSQDRTNYFETFAASDDNLDWALKLEADRLVNSNIARSDLDSEMTVVRNEMERNENNPERMLYQKMSSIAFQWHNYGRDTIGARSDVENVNIAHLQAFYRNFYQPDNAVLIVTGQFDEQKTLSRIAQYFGPIAKPTRELEPMWTVEPVQDGAREVTLARVGDTQLVGTVYHIPQGAHPDYAALSVLTQILGDTPTGRLHKALVEKKKAASVEGWAEGLHDPSLMAFFVQLNKNQSREEASRALLAALEDIKQHPITEAELNRAKTALQNEFEKTLNDPTRFGVSLSESIGEGDWRLLFIERDQTAAVTLADVQRVAENYLKPANRTLGQFVPTDKPERAAMPAPVDIAALTAGYKGKDAVAAVAAFDTSPDNIEKHTVRTTLANGMRVAELAKPTRGQIVSGALLIDMGTEKSLFGKKFIAGATASMLTRGAGQRSRQNIADRIEELKAKLNVSNQNGSVYVNFETRRDKLAGLLDLLHDLLRAPTFPASELEQLKTEWLTSVNEQRHQPNGIAEDMLGRYDNPYPKGDIRYASTFDEQIAAAKTLQVADLKAFHAGFYGMDHAQLSLVGDFDSAAVDAQLAKLFGDWKSKQPYAHVVNPYRVTKASELTAETPDKANAVYLAALAVPLADSDPHYPAMVLANRILGGGGLKNRLVDRLRQKEGISYYAGSEFNGNPYEPNSTLEFEAIYAPENLAKLKAGVSEEVARLLKDGITAQELAEAKSGILQESAISRAQDGSLANKLAWQLRFKRTLAWTADYEARLQATSQDDVNAALRKYLDPQHLVQVYAGDFANAAKKAAAKPQGAAAAAKQ